MGVVERAYESARAEIGKLRVVHLGVVSVRDFQRFAYATGDENPIYLDPVAAREAGRASVVAPPLFLTSIMTWEPGPAESALRPDGAGRSELANVPLEGLRLMGAGQDLQFHADVVDGQEVSMEISVEDVELKHGASGPLLLLRLRRDYRDADGHPLVTCRETFIGR